jgi:hypothetical protein
MKTGLLFSILLFLLSVVGNAQTSSSCDSVVKKVAFEYTTGLSPEQQTSLKKLLIGRCFQRRSPGVLSEAVYKQLLAWGFKQPTVYDPDHGHDILVLDETVKPSPVAVTIDFRLTGF